MRQIEPFAPVEEYLKALDREVRNRCHIGRQWRRHAWNIIMTDMARETEAAREVGPVAVVHFAQLAELAVEYLGTHPERERYRQLHTRMLYVYDRAELLTSFPNLWHPKAFTDEEHDLILKGKRRYDAVLNRIAIFCPDTT